MNEKEEQLKELARLAIEQANYEEVFKYNDLLKDLKVNNNILLDV